MIQAVGMAFIVLVAASPVGCGQQTDTSSGAVADGMVVATEGGLDGGRIWFIWDGEKARIYQPRPLAKSDIAALGLRIAEPAPKRLTLGREEDPDVFFAVYPADSEDSALYLAEWGELHLVNLTEGDDRDVKEVPQAEDAALAAQARTGARAPTATTTPAS